MNQRPTKFQMVQLEDRVTPATITVNSALDLAVVDLTDAVVTLRDAVAAANGNVAPAPGAPAGEINGDIINFAPTLSGSTITLTNGELLITDDVIITGGDVITISGNNTSRIFNVAVTDLTPPPANTFSVTFDRLTLTQGFAGAGKNGGAIIAADGNDVGVNNSTISNSSADNGGAVYSGNGFLAVGISTFTNNKATAGVANTGGGAIFIAGGTGGIFDSTFTGNMATGNGDGGAILNMGPNTDDFVIGDSMFMNNMAGRAGGGIENNGGSVILDGVTLDTNTAGVNGGGLHTSGAGTVLIDNEFNPTLIQNNIAQMEGGGLWNSATGTLTIANQIGTKATIITMNTAGGPDADQGGRRHLQRWRHAHHHQPVDGHQQKHRQWYQGFGRRHFE